MYLKSRYVLTVYLTVFDDKLIKFSKIYRYLIQRLSQYE